MVSQLVQLLCSVRTPLRVLLVGHLCHDVVPGGFSPGGTVAFAATVAHQLGCLVHIITSFGPDYAYASLFDYAEMHVVPAKSTTCFENIYTPSGRVQFLKARAAEIMPSHWPEEWPEPDVVLLGPIADEVSRDWLDCFPMAFKCVCPQGWFRQWDDAGRVRPKRIPMDGWPSKADVVVISDEDLAGDRVSQTALRKQARRLIITHGERGATLVTGGKEAHFPAVEARLVNATGAGDVFATSFAIRFRQCGDERQAMAFAMRVAAKSVEYADLREFQIF